MAFVRITGFIS